jgi:hypothetical protein
LKTEREKDGIFLIFGILPIIFLPFGGLQGRLGAIRVPHTARGDTKGGKALRKKRPGHGAFFVDG